jgi:hypothetical protein
MDSQRLPQAAGRGEANFITLLLTAWWAWANAPLPTLGTHTFFTNAANASA